MRIVLLAVAATVIVFLAVMYLTGDLWSATNASGVVALAVMALYAVALVRLIRTLRAKMVAGTVAALLLFGVIAHWGIMFGMTTWQYEVLRRIRRVIAYGVVQDDAHRNGIAILRRADSAGVGAGEAFALLGGAGRGAADTVALGNDLGGIFRTVASSDTGVVFTYEAGSVPGLDPSFLNSDGRRGYFEHRVTFSKGGMDYVIRN
jgi:hypothetical protein